jgi:hypothetical protein
MNPTTGVLTEAWDLYKSQARHFISIAAIVYVAVALITLILVAALDVFGALIAALVSIVGVYWVQGALVRAVEDARDGRVDLSLGETFAKVQPNLPAIIIAGLLAALGIALGFVLLIVPGLILMTIWSLIVPVIVLENRRATESFGRSRELVRGYGWQVFGIILLTLLLLIAVGIVVEILLSFADESVRATISNIVSGALTAPFLACTWTLLYFRLREVQAEAGPAA